MISSFIETVSILTRLHVFRRIPLLGSLYDAILILNLRMLRRCAPPCNHNHTRQDVYMHDLDQAGASVMIVTWRARISLMPSSSSSTFLELPSGHIVSQVASKTTCSYIVSRTVAQHCVIAAARHW